MKFILSLSEKYIEQYELLKQNQWTYEKLWFIFEDSGGVYTDVSYPYIHINNIEDISKLEYIIWRSDTIMINTFNKRITISNIFV